MRCGGRSISSASDGSADGSTDSSAENFSGGGRRRGLPSLSSGKDCPCTLGADDVGAILSRFKLADKSALSTVMAALVL
jgi:hypothetical protein